MDEPLHPEQIGRYEIVLPIASGGMATVYLARVDGIGGFGRYVAVKLTSESLTADPEFAWHLIEEAKLVSQLRHPNVVPVLDVGESDRGVYLVMEYVPGDALYGLIREGRARSEPLPTRVGLRVLVDALAGLHAAHEHESEDGQPLNVVHRDFSPQNILVGTDGIARLTDFGVAKATSRASTTAAGTIKGKISYIAPEQAKGAEVDRRADVWSAGIIAWELLAGRKLFGSDQRALLDIISGDPPRLSSVAPEVPAAIDDAIARVLVQDPDARTPTAEAFARELAAAAKDANMLADVAEVAQHVNRLAGPALVERKARMASVRQQRAAGQAIPTAIGIPSLPSLPDLPEATGVTSIMLRDDDLADDDDTEASSTVPIPDVFAPPPPPPPNVAEAPLVAPPRVMEHVRPSRPEPIPWPLAAPPAPSAAATVVRNVRAKVMALTPKQRMIAGGGAGLGFLFLLITVIAISCSGSPKPPDDLFASASSSAIPAIPATVAATVMTAVPTATGAVSITVAPTPPDPGVWPTTIEITADSPIAFVRIDDRPIDIASPTTKVNVELEPYEENRDVRIIAQSADGRRVTTTTKPTAPVTLSFANAPAAPPPVAAPAHPPVVTTKRAYPPVTKKKH